MRKTSDFAIWGKGARRHLARFCLFCLLAALLLGYADRVLWDKSGTIMGFYEEPRNTVDVLYVGGSHTNAAVSPTQIYTQTGATGYVLYSWSQPIWTGYHYLIEGLKTQKPKVVVMDAFGLVYGNTYMTDVDMNTVSDDYSLLIPPSLNRLELALAMSRCQTEHKPFYSYASLLRYHNRWKALTPADFLWPFQRYGTSGKGFGPLYTTEVYPQQRQPAEITPSDAMYAPSALYLQKLIDLSKAKNFQLVLVNYPYIAEDLEYDIYAAAKETCAANDVPFIDYLLEDTAAEANFDYATDMAEHAHVNYRGAEKISADLAKRLAAYNLPDHRTDAAYAAWGEDAAQEKRNMQDMDLRVTADLDALLGKALTGDYLVSIAACGDLTAADSTAVQAAMAAHGMDAALMKQTDAGFLYSWDGTALTLTDGQAAGAPAAATLTAADGTTLAASAGGGEAHCTAKDAKTGVLGEVSRNRPGLNIVVADKATGKLVYSVSYSTQQAYTAFTQ